MDDDPQFDERDEQADEVLLDRLRAVAAQRDPVPDEAVLAARSMLAYLRLDAELAELTFDSVDVDPALAGVRGGTQAARLLTFEAGATQIEVEIVQEGALRRLVGQCLPATEVALTVRCQEEGDGRVSSTQTLTDEHGRFSVEIPAGSVSLRCVWTHVELAVETAWVRV